MNTFLGIALETFVVLALVAANGFFVAAEFALVKVRVSQLRPLEKTGGWRVKFALQATKHLDAALSATQLGITLASLGLGWVGEPYIAHRVEPLLTSWGFGDPATVSSVSFAIAFSVITFLHIIFGELAPKSLAIQRAKSVTLWIAAPLLVFYYIFFPFIWLLNGIANRFLRWAGLGPASEGDHAFSADELEYVFSRARHSHPGDALINKLMVQSLRVRETTAQQIMLPRDQVVALWLDKPIAENLRTAQISGHSRFPVCTGSMDEVRGLLLVRDGNEYDATVDLHVVRGRVEVGARRAKGREKPRARHAAFGIVNQRVHANLGNVLRNAALQYDRTSSQKHNKRGFASEL